MFTKGHPQFNTGRTHFKKGAKGYWTGKKRDADTIRKISECKKGSIGWNKGMKGLQMGQKNGNWKGDEAKYRAKHTWIVRQRGKPQECEHCDLKDPVRRYNWANKDHQYKRVIEDWIRLCVPCHRAYDKAHNPRLHSETEGMVE